MKDFKGISIIGTGNVAWHLGAAFKNAGIKINVVVGRDSSKAKGLSKELGASFSCSYSDIPKDSSLILICVTDSAIESVANAVLQFGIPLVHTSGTMPLSVLQENNSVCGVFYPFQTFSKEIRRGEIVFPICVEASNEAFLGLLGSLALKISNKVEILNSEQRRHLHLSGVVVNNFANHLYHKAFNYLDQYGLDKSLLLPIIAETTEKIKTSHPKDAQTGPAARGNLEIIKKHLDLLESEAALSNIYEVMSNSILATFSKNEE